MSFRLYFLLPLVLLLSVGCQRSLTSHLWVPAPDAPWSEIWAYAASLDVEPYAAQRFGSYPDGLRRAVTQHRIDYLANRTLAGKAADLQAYLFFEYRRNRSLGENAEPDAQTAAYVRALVSALHYM